MKILLTGHEGYVGAGLLRFFTAGAGHEVVGWGRADDIRTITAGRLRDLGIEAVVNCATAMDRVKARLVLGSPDDEVNVVGVRALVSALAGSEIRLVHVSTKDVFGPVYAAADVDERDDRYELKFRVDDDQPFRPETVYAKTKLIGEFLCEGHALSTVVRLSSGYTDFDHRRGNWVVNMIKGLQAGRPVAVNGTGKQVRDLLHADDLGRLILRILEAPADRVAGLKLNAGGGPAGTVSLLEFLRAAGHDGPVGHNPGGDFGFGFNNRVAREVLGWEPEVRFLDRLPTIIANVRAGRTAEGVGSTEATR